MGKLHILYEPSELNRLTQEQRDELQRRLTEEIRKDPMAAAIIEAHQKMVEILKEKLE
jgi:hypothetical protein